MICQWFLLCTNPADGVVPHPVLGDVPCCLRCARKYDLPIILTEPELEPEGAR